MKESTCSGKRPVCVGDIKFDKDRVAWNGGAQPGMISGIEWLPIVIIIIAIITIIIVIIIIIICYRPQKLKRLPSTPGNETLQMSTSAQTQMKREVLFKWKSAVRGG